MLVKHSIKSPPAQGDTYAERWEGPDAGLVCCWLRGIELANERPALAVAAKAGELPVLPYRGGVDKPIKTQTKVGALAYLAAWHGLRGEDLHIDTDAEVRLTCSRTNVPVTFTADMQKLWGEGREEIA